MNWQLKTDIFMSLEMISQWPFWPFLRETSALRQFSHSFLTKLYGDNMEHLISYFLCKYI